MSRLGVQNIFEFLADENDDNKARAQPRKAAAPAAAAQPKPKPAGDKPVGDKPVRPPKEDRPKAAAGDAQAPRKPREQREPREPREPRPPRDNANRPPRQFAPRTDNAAPAGAAPAGAAPAEANLEEKPGSQVGRRGDRPPRQAGGDVNRDKSNTRVFKDRVRNETPKDRIFDRKSGTGRSDKEIKKGGSGKGNWGKEGEEAKEILATEDAPVKEAKGEATEERTDDVAADAAVDPEAPQQPPAKPNLGLEEYQALKQKERANLDSLLNDFKKKEAKERNPTDEQSWEGFKVLKRDEEDSKAAQAKKEKAAKKEKKAPVVLPVNFAAGDAKPNTKGKGKGRAPGDAKPTAPTTPDVTNKDAFPALRATPTPVATSS